MAAPPPNMIGNLVWLIAGVAFAMLIVVLTGGAFDNISASMGEYREIMSGMERRLGSGN